MTWPGFDPQPPGWKADALTTRLNSHNLGKNNYLGRDSIVRLYLVRMNGLVTVKCIFCLYYVDAVLWMQHLPLFHPMVTKRSIATLYKMLVHKFLGQFYHFIGMISLLLDQCLSCYVLRWLDNLNQSYCWQFGKCSHYQ